MLDAMFASALKKLLNTQSTFRKKYVSETNELKNSDRFLRGRQNCTHDRRVCPCNRSFWNSTRTRRLGQCGFAECRGPRFRCKMGSCTIINWVKCLQTRSWKDCAKSTLQNPAQLRIVMALHDQEVARDNDGTRNYQQLKKNCSETSCFEKSENQSTERCCGKEFSHQESKKERKHALRRKWESVFSGKHKDNVPKEIPVVSVMTFYKLLETEVAVRDEKNDRLLLHPIQRQDRLTEKKTTKRGNLTREVKFHVDIKMLLSVV